MRKFIRKIILVVVFCMVLVGCGSKQSDMEISQKESESTSYDIAKDDMATTDSGVSQETVNENSTNNETTQVVTTGEDKDISNSVEANRKIIRTVTLGLETQEFDKVTEAIQSKISNLGGYAENINMDDLLSNSNRYCTITARIPAKNLDQFVTSVSKVGNVVSKNMSAEDITVNYVDMETHVKVLKVEQARLIALIEKAVDLDSIILLENRLTEIRYDLENYQSQLRMYDNLVQYNTVNITVNEVIRYSSIVNKESTWKKMKLGLSDTMYSIKTDIKNFAIFVVVNIPYIIFGVIIIGIVTIVIKKNIKKNKEKHFIINANKENTNNSK